MDGGSCAVGTIGILLARSSASAAQHGGNRWAGQAFHLRKSADFSQFSYIFCS
jgi:hypothetical protein